MIGIRSVASILVLLAIPIALASQTDEGRAPRTTGLAWLAWQARPGSIRSVRLLSDDVAARCVVAKHRGVVLL